jgi:hypothetical protein
MAEGLHTIRFKRDGVEFEMTGSQEDVEKAWAALEPSVVSAFTEAQTGGRRRQQQASEPDPGDQGNGNGKPKAKPKPKSRRSASGATKSGGEREEILTKLLDADFDTFPELPNNAKAVYTGLATLRWARDELGIDGLAITEIHRFLSDKLRYGQTSEAYRLAFKSLPRATNATGTPKIYRLMRPGDDALDAYLKTVAAGGSEKEAEQAGAEAEQKA